MVFPVVGGDGKPTGYEIDNSLRFNDGDSPALSRTPSSTGNRRTFTISAWVKRCKEDNVDEGIFNAMVEPYDGQNRFVFGITSAGQLNIYNRTGGTTYSLASTDLLRDPSAWYHCVCIIDSTDSTEADRQRMYLNGRRITSFADNSPISSQNAETAVSRNDAKHAVGDKQWTSDHFDGYIAEHYYLDGVAYEPTYFAETNDNGVWVPKQYTGGNFGTNGHFLQFKQTGTGTNSSGMGADTSGNDNHFAVTNLAAIDVTTDTPTNNFCTLNPLYQQGSNTFSEGNCKVVLEAGDGSKGVAGGIAPANGKWYWEVKQGSATNSSILVREASDKEDDLSYYQGNFAGYVFNNGNQNITGNTNSTYGPSYSSGDIIMVAMDMDNDRVYFGKNGSWIDGEGNADEANINDFVPLNGVTNGLGAFANANGSATATAEFNWGNPSFSISSGNADANGYGNFEYAVPSGYYALCTKNLAEFG